MATDGPDRITVCLDADARAALARLLGRTDHSKTEVTQRALKVYDLVDDSIRKGGRVYVEDADGKFIEVRIL